MDNSLSNKNKIIVAFLVLVVVLFFGLRYGSMYAAFGLCIIISMMFFVLNEKIKKLNKVTINILGILISGGLGALFFITVLSPKVLNTSSINWLLMRGDPAQHYLGWLFFKNDQWNFPPGIINSLNTPIGTTITYTDSIPLLAFVFKVFNPILPNTFQYLGLWILLCYILQGTISFMLLKRLTTNFPLQLLGMMFFIMSPIMLWRAYGHEALMGHWIILAALYLFKSTYAHRYWLVLFIISLLVHPYIFIMVLIIFVIKLIELVAAREINIRECFLYFITACLLIFLTLWFIGYFYIGSSGTAGGFGYYSMNINSIFNPQGWSQYFLKDQPSATQGQYEGFNYLGIGVILLLLWAFYISIHMGKMNVKKNISSLLIITLFTLIALSNVITYSDKILVEVPLPAILLKICGVIRASGRFFWPVYYLLMLVSLSSILRNTKTKVAAILLVTALSLQFTDLSGKFNEFHTMYTSDTAWENPLASDVWGKISEKRFHNIVFVPAKVNDQYIAFSMLAGEKNMSINAFYTARDDDEKREKYNNTLVEKFKKGEWDSESIYVVDNSLFERTMANKGKTDLFLSADGFNLFIPNGAIDPELKNLNLDLYSFNYNYGDVINFGAKGNSHLVKSTGWNSPEENSTWTEGKQADLIFSLKKPKNDLTLSMEISPLLGANLKAQRLVVHANNKIIKELTIDSENTYQFYIPREIVNTQLKISMSLPDATTPYKLGINEDQRILALSVKSLRLDQVSP